MLRRRAVQQRGCLVASFYCSGTTLFICCLFGFNYSKDMLLYLCLSLSHFIALGSMNSINHQRTEEVVAEGRNINLTCKYEGAIYNIQWYRQHQRSRPEFLLYITEGGFIHPSDSNFPAHIDKTDKRVDLEIISAKVSDSAVYYCALQPGTKIVFGSGTTLTVELKDVYEPSYFELTDDDEPETKVCLATGFSRYNVTGEHRIFNKTFNEQPPVRISDDSLFNQVAFFSDPEECGGTEEPGPCTDGLKPDPQVNFVTVTILGLRLLFIKTVVFNVLLTLRLWISR